MYPLTHSNRGTIAPPAASTDLVGVKLANGGRTEYLTFTARARVTISVAAITAILNRGSVWSLFPQVVLDENGDQRQFVHGRVLRFVSEMSAPSALSATRLTSLEVGTTMLEETARMYFSHPMSLDPTETAYIEQNIQQTLLASVRQAVNLATNLTTPGAGTVVIDQVSVDVLQSFRKVKQGDVPPFFVPTSRELIVPITGALTAYPIPLLTTKPVRHLIVSQETTTVGEVGDIITRFALKGDYTNIVGPSSVSYADWVLAQEYEFGGAVVSANRAHMGFNFQRYGRLSNVFSPVQDANLRLEVDANVSASAGNSQLRITLFELSRDPGVVAEKVPFQY